MNAQNGIRKIKVAADWDAAVLQKDQSWIVYLNDSHKQELDSALSYFKQKADDVGQAAQWLHGNMVPTQETFPLETLAVVMAQVQSDLEHKYGLFLLKGLPTDEYSQKDLQLLHAGLSSYIGTVRPQTVFGELSQSITDVGQAAHIERRGSKHNKALSFHNDPSDVVSFLCLKQAQTGGEGIFASSVAIHNAMLETMPEHVETLYKDYFHTYQDYLFIKTGMNDSLMPDTDSYSLPIFTTEAGYFSCKYSRFYIDQSQERENIPRLTQEQEDALNAFENELSQKKWHVTINYEPGDLVFCNNFVCFHSRSAFNDNALDPSSRRHLFRLWLSASNSRPLSPRYKHYFFKDLEAGAIRGGMPLPSIEYGM